MKLRLTHILAGAALIALPQLAHAQPTAHYVPGVEGIKGASLPPPGVYLRDYNVIYFADQLNDDDGDKISGVDPDVFIYANVPRVLWITDWQLLGGFVGFDALMPLQYTSFEGNIPAHYEADEFGIGDFFIETTWSKHITQWDFSLAYGLWTPTGDSGTPVQAGLGYFTHMFTAGATWYPDKEKKWSISALNRYEINHESSDADITPGHAYTLEMGIGRTLTKTIEVGAVGYFQQQVTTDDGDDSTNARDRVAGIGPEINAFCSKIGVNTSIRYLYEFFAENRLQGHTVAVVFTKRF